MPMEFNGHRGFRFFSHALNKMEDINQNNGGSEAGNMDGGKTSWMKLVMKVKKSNPKLSLGQAMKIAKKSYKKKTAKRGGASSIVPATYNPSGETPTTGGRRRTRKGSKKGTRKTRKNRKH